MTSKGPELPAGRQETPECSARPQFPQLPHHVISKGTSGSERKQATTKQPWLQGIQRWGSAQPLPVDPALTRGRGRGRGQRARGARKAGAPAWSPRGGGGEWPRRDGPLTWKRRRRRRRRLEGLGGSGSSRPAPPPSRPSRPADRSREWGLPGSSSRAACPSPASPAVTPRQGCRHQEVTGTPRRKTRFVGIFPLQEAAAHQRSRDGPARFHSAERAREGLGSGGKDRIVTWKEICQSKLCKIKEPASETPSPHV